jgi:D-alanyl-lipoteichoic acid acyltransferase DltB (MBOAT superfamily)
MLFNSYTFLLFFPIFFVVYWFVLGQNRKQQNIWIAIASFVFYGWWDWRFLGLLFISLLVDYYSGIWIETANTRKKSKTILIISLLINIGILFTFKYFNFFAASLVQLLDLVGWKADFVTLNVILPVGISFYTFQSMSYTIDVYRKKLPACKSIVDYSAYISFFPQLVAGPIERATNLLPQFASTRQFDYQHSVTGMQLILWGLFKKVVLADSCSEIVNVVFDNYNTLNGTVLLSGALFFAFQIYGDFSGYTDIARGLSRLLGFELMVNFNYPYFSRDIAEFWRRWHISLSSWFRDYVYFPLGGSQQGKRKAIQNTFIIFIVSGIWHGANWTFVFWGLLNALYFLPLLLFNANRQHLTIVANNTSLPSFKEMSQMLFTFLLVCIAWVFFRAENLTQAFGYLYNMRKLSISFIPGLPFELFFCFFVVVMEWIGRHNTNTLQGVIHRFATLKWVIYLFLFALVFTYFSREQSFIYFQF